MWIKYLRISERKEGTPLCWGSWMPGMGQAYLNRLKFLDSFLSESEKWGGPPQHWLKNVYCTHEDQAAQWRSAPQADDRGSQEGLGTSVCIKIPYVQWATCRWPGMNFRTHASSGGGNHVCRKILVVDDDDPCLIGSDCVPDNSRNVTRRTTNHADLRKNGPSLYLQIHGG